LHGSQGQGRYKALSIGRSIAWTYYYPHGEAIFEFTISILGDDPSQVRYSEPQLSKRDRTGCVVEIREPIRQFKNLNNEEAKDIADSEFSSIIVRLMMAVNDASIVNALLKDWCASEDKVHKWRKSNGRLFLAKLQMAYGFEALSIVKDVKASEALKAHIEKLSEAARKAFEELVVFTDSADYTLLAEFRNSAAFHYDSKRATQAVTEIAKESPGDLQGASEGDEPINWYYALGDRVYERIVTRYIFKVPTDKDIAEGSDAIANRFFDASEKFVVFGAALIKQLT
jgi:hypothetical protein